MTPTASRKPLWSRAWFQIAAVLLACAIVYWFRLGTGGLHSTEGHRAIPAYEILESGDWLVTTMFGQPYLRKPPGMPCAFAISTLIFGESAWSARAVSALAATLMALVALRFARLWFGPAGGLAAALTCALTPWLLESGRAAEIEALNTLGTMLAAYGLIHVGVARGSWRAATVTLLGVVILTLAKGPASVPLLIGVLAAIGITTRWRTLASPKLSAPVILGFAVFGAVAVAIALR
ncbi:MAG: glycosyltransferase family 39 protein, partial [Planctomycetota bacterium]